MSLCCCHSNSLSKGCLPCPPRKFSQEWENMLGNPLTLRKKRSASLYRCNILTSTIFHHPIRAKVNTCPTPVCFSGWCSTCYITSYAIDFAGPMRILNKRVYLPINKTRSYGITSIEWCTVQPRGIHKQVLHLILLCTLKRSPMRMFHRKQGLVKLSEHVDQQEICNWSTLAERLGFPFV